MTETVVGRDQELSSVYSFLDHPVEGAAGLVLEGEPGIGKSTLWLAAVAAARERGLLVLSARPAEAERGLAYVGLGDLFEDELEVVLPRLSPPRRRAFEAALLLEDAVPEAVDPRALGIAVRDALQLLAEPGPPVLAVDDLQWLDAASASALAFAFRRLDESPVLLLFARRLAEGGQASEIERALPVESLRRLMLGPLSVGALHAFLRDRLDRSFARQTLLRIHEHSGGNPFFALELARALGSEVDPTKPLPVPRTLEELVRERLAGLPKMTRDALALAAALGAPSEPLLARAGVDEHALDAAVEAQVIQRDNGALRFTHPLLSSVLLADLGAERQDVHRRLAGIVDDPVVRARHLALATEAPDDVVAAVLDDAAGTARERGATALAAELAEHALRLTDGDERPRRALAVARAQNTAGEWTRARAIASSVLDGSETGALRAEALLLVADQEHDDLAVPFLEDALREASSDPALRVQIQLRLAWAARFRSGFAVALERVRVALSLAEELGDDHLRFNALLGMNIIGALVGDPQTRVYVARARELAIAVGDERLLRELHTFVESAVYADVGDLGAARSVLEREYRAWHERDELLGADLLWNLAWVGLWSGSWQEAAANAARARDIRVQYGVERHQDYIPSSWIAAHRGELEVALEESQRGLELCEEQVGFPPPLLEAVPGLVALWGGDAPTAVERLGQAERHAAALAWGAPEARPWTADHAEALLELGRIDEAVQLVERWENDAIRLGRKRVLAQVVRCRGLIAAAQGRVDEAANLLPGAVARHAEVGDPFGRARALLALGVVLRRQRQKRAARNAIAEALAGFEQIGAATWIEKARGELGRLGGRTRARGLTAAERRVAALVAEGRTNKEVAAVLFLGERTVETHLSHVYAKLGVRSRAELARTFRADEQSSGEPTISS